MKRTILETRDRLFSGLSFPFLGMVLMVLMVLMRLMRQKSYERAPLTTDPLEDFSVRMVGESWLVAESSPAQSKSLPF